MLWGVSERVSQKRLDFVFALEPPPDLLPSEQEVGKHIEVAWKGNELELLTLKAVWAGDFVTFKLEQNLAPQSENFTYFNSTVKPDASTSAKLTDPKPSSPCCFKQLPLPLSSNLLISQIYCSQLGS